MVDDGVRMVAKGGLDLVHQPVSNDISELISNA